VRTAQQIFLDPATEFEKWRDIFNALIEGAAK
jgi:hypothetical protein